MSTNSYIDKLKAKINKLSTELAHWKMLAQERNKFIIVTEIDPDSRTIEEFYIDAESVRCAWKMIRDLRDQIERMQTK